MAKIWREEKQLQPKHDSLWGWSICRNFHSAVKVGSHPTFIFAACHSLLMLREASMKQEVNAALQMDYTRAVPNTNASKYLKLQRGGDITQAIQFAVIIYLHTMLLR